MKEKIGILIVVGIIIFSFCLAHIAYADELSELKEQIKTMCKQIEQQARQMDAMQKQYQKQVQALKEKIAELERITTTDVTEKPQKTQKEIKERLAKVEEKVDKAKPEWMDKIRIKGSLWTYYISQDNSYFGKTSSHFLETTARIGVEAKLTDNISADIQLLGENAIGDATDYTGVTTDDWNVEPELANITYGNILDEPLSVTLGRQNLEYGDGFLIYDGYSDKRAVWTMSMRSFYAIKGVYKLDSLQLDAFAAMVDQDYKSYETFLTDATTRTGRRNLYGGNLHFEKEKYGIWDFGVFYKEDKSALDSDTLVLSQRGSYTFDLWPQSHILPQLILEGEIVEEFGRTKVQNYALTTSRHDRRSFGGHIDSTLCFTKLNWSPYVRASYIHLPGDDPDTSNNEAFDPMFYGFKDWGKWLIGSINSYNLFNSNQRTVMAEVGLHPTEATMVRGFYFYTRLDRQIMDDAGKNWSHEFNIIFDWYPNKWFFCGAEFGYAHPLNAARAYAGDDQDTTEFVLWVGVEF